MIEATLDKGQYPGGKNQAGVWPWIVAKMPTHALYVEPFVGSGACLRRKTPALRSVVIDRDAAVCRWWRKLRWPGVEVVHGCGIRWLARNACELTADALIYLDPPYPLHVRTKKRIYRYEMTLSDHRRLLELLPGLVCHVMVSSYASRLYDDALAGWSRFELPAMTRRGLRTEVLWCNFEPAGHGQFVRPVVGRNFRERERIKRKLQRWAKNYGRLPNYERQALLTVLLNAENGLQDPTAANGDARGNRRP